MKIKKMLPLVLALGAGLNESSVTAVAVVYAEARDANNNRLGAQFTYASGEDFSITINTNTASVHVWADPNSDNIGRITVNGVARSEGVALVLGVTAWSGGGSSPTSTAGANWEGLFTTVNRLGVWGKISGNLTSSFAADRLFWLSVGGTLQQGFTIESGEGLGVIEAGSIAAGATITREVGPLDLRISGNVDGTIRTLSGSISSVQIGSFENMISGDLNGNIECLGGNIPLAAINGDIGPNGSLRAPGGQIGPSPILIAGSMSGAIEALRAQLTRIDGDMSGAITVSLGLLNSGLSQGDALRIGGSFLSPGRIFLPDDGLEGWVSINWQDVGGVWENGAEVVFGDSMSPTRVLTSPDYPDLPSDLGGGSVGLARFQLHREACTPPDGAIIDNAMEAPATIRTRHYGLVYWADMGRPISTTGTVPCRVSKRCDTQPPKSWEDITDEFSQRLVPFLGEGSTVTWAMEVEFIPDGFEFEEGYEYRVQVDDSPADADDRMLCEGVGSNPASGPDLEVYSPDYTFVYRTPCVADLNGDGVVNTADLGILLENFSESEQCVPGDLNGDGIVNTPDLGILIGAFGMTCPGSESLLGGGGPGEILEQFGFESLEDYIEWLDGLTEQEVADHVAELIELVS